jgi:hypothetical protein
MQSEPQTAPAPKWMLWTGWIMTALPALGLLMSGVMKFVQPPGMDDQFKHLGWDMRLAHPLGITEIGCTLIYLIPSTSVLGATLLTGYLGGAVATHVRIGEPFFIPIILGILVWGGLYLRDERLRALTPWRS